MNSIVSFSSSLVFLLFCFASHAQSFSGGDGSATNPYQITTKAQLLDVKNYSSGNYILNNDIDMGGDHFTGSIIPAMNGNFNGAGHTISNILFEGQYVSFFGTIAAASIVANLHLRNISFTHYDYNSATTRAQNQNHVPFAYTNNGTVQNSSYASTSNDVSGYSRVAGFIFNNFGSIKNCYVNANVTGLDSYNNSGTWFGGRYITGMVFENKGTGIIENCYYAGVVNTGDYSTGGFVYSNAGTIKNSFSLATSVVSPWYGNEVFRFAGSNSGTLTNNYARAEMTLNGSAISSSDASSINAKDVATSLLNQASTYTDQGWDFTNIWVFETNSPLPTIHMTDIALPSTFNKIAAQIVNGQLMVNWSTLTEANCDYYNIEASADGNTFTKIGTLKSKSIGGNSSSILQYEYGMPLSSVALGISLLFITLGLVSRRHNATTAHRGATGILGIGLITVSILLFASLSCSKQDIPVTGKSSKVFVRIAHVDKDGTVHYSKIIEAINE